MDAQIFSSSPMLLIVAFFLDLIISDPRWLPHPVILMGRVISWVEAFLRSGKPRRDFFAGILLSVALIALSVTAAWLLVGFLSVWPASISFLAIAVLASSTLATRGLLDAVRRIESPLRAGDLGRIRALLRRRIDGSKARENFSLSS
jgi:adenosylcobinamide-phosphate synthase